MRPFSPLIIIFPLNFWYRLTMVVFEYAVSLHFQSEKDSAILDHESHYLQIQED